MPILFIDDVRDSATATTVARTPDEAIATLRLFEHVGFDEVSFDHDLGLDFDIWDVVRFLERRASEGRPIPIAQCVVHSMNPVGASRLAQALDRAGYRVYRQVPLEPLRRRTT